MALKLTALVPLTMVILYGLLALYFRSTGGYKVEHLSVTGDEVSGLSSETASETG